MSKKVFFLTLAFLLILSFALWAGLPNHQNVLTSKDAGGEANLKAKTPQSWYYKPGYVDYCPTGMPDFSQQQDFTWPPDGVIDAGYCGPVAVANCFWWFDSKFEPNPLIPPTYSDGYPLVQTYSTVLPPWDDHDSQNAVPFIRALGVSMNTNMIAPGTALVDMHKAIGDWLTSRQLQNNYDVSTYQCQQINWDFLAHEVIRSQDVILLLGFYTAVNGNPSYCCRIGGHYVTVAGVDSANYQIAISDPFLDILNPAVVSHNDAAIVSHDIYNVAVMGPGMCDPWAGCMFMPGYPGAAIAWDFYNQNGGSTCQGPSQAGPIFTIIEAAEIVCPKLVDTCTYYKPSYPDYAPMGVPDFDQKQDNWVGATQTWSFCGPVALADCFWWFDSKFDTSTTPPPTVKDNYPLVRSFTTMLPKWDDHDPVNVIPFVDSLAKYSNCSNTTKGTYIHDLAAGARAWIDSCGLAGYYTVREYPAPSIAVIGPEILRSQNVILLLGFYEVINGSECNRLGGHYVTAAGICEQEPRICISDPWYDKNEGEPPAGSAHGSAVHNDAGLVSGPHGTHNHDAYLLAMGPTCPNLLVGPMTELTDYPDGWSNIANFEGQNATDPPSTTQLPYQGGDIHTLIDWAIVICPDSCANQIPGDVNNDGLINIDDATYLVNWLYKGGSKPPILANADPNGDCCIDTLDIQYLAAYLAGGPAPVSCTCVNPTVCNCQVGDANHDGRINVGDAVYLINFVFKSGPAPTPYPICSGDANCDCKINVGDAVYVINYVFKNGPASCRCCTWLTHCGTPLRN